MILGIKVIKLTLYKWIMNNGSQNLVRLSLITVSIILIGNSFDSKQLGSWINVQAYQLHTLSKNVKNMLTTPNTL